MTKRLVLAAALVILLILPVIGGMTFLRKAVAKEAYLQQTLILFKDTVVSTGKIGNASTSVSTAKISIGKGAERVRKERLRLSTIRDKIKSHDAPPGFQDFQDNFAKALNLYIEAGDKLAKGYKLNDTSDIKDATVIWSKAGTRLDNAFEALGNAE